MGKATRVRPTRLPKKLKHIRERMGLGQVQMARELTRESERIYPATISQFENDKREPSLLCLLRYARLANICVDDLIDDEVELPTRLPVKTNNLTT
jgi:DNA-binding XRE family transcriptional regulator